MVRVLFLPNSVHLSDVINNSQFGNGPYYIGFRQRGYGFGDILRTAWRFLQPLVKTVGREGLNVGARVLNDVNQGADLSSTLKKQGAQSAQRMLERASEKAGQYGQGKKRKRHLSKREVVGRLLKKKPALKIRDIL